MVMRKRDLNHYLSVNERVNIAIGRIKEHKPTICFNEQLFGVLGYVKGKDMRANKVKIAFYKEIEEQKIHNPFISENFLKR
jgi:hypothetical protein